MIVELIDKLGSPPKKKYSTCGDTYQSTLFPDPATIELSAIGKDTEGIYERRPWIHISDPFDFQLFMVSPCVNHVAVPWCRALRAVL